MRIIYSCIICLSSLVMLSGCTSTGSYVSTEKTETSYIGSILKKNLDYEGIERNPIIIIHGFQGAELVDEKTNQKVWGNFDASTIFYISDDKIESLAHPIDKEKKLSQMQDSIVPSSILKKVDVSILGIPLKFPAYQILEDVLCDAGYQPETEPLDKDKNYYTLFEFAYDWRKDIPTNTKKLEAFIEEKRQYLQKAYQKQYGVEEFDVQFDVIAHSMGGLLSRYYLEYGTQDLPEDGSLPEVTWGGNKFIDRLIICGTPNAGYLDTFIEMLKGGKLQLFKPALLGTLPTYYQMLPAPERKSIVFANDHDKEVDYFNPDVWEKMEWGLMGADADESLVKLLPNVKTKEERAEIAKDHLTKCLKRAKQFIAAMAVDTTPPDDIEMYLVLGHGIKTTRRAYVNGKTGKIDSVDYASGDGKVTATSALWDIRDTGKWNFFMTSPIKWHNILVIRAAHMGILNSPVFQDNILLLLPMRESPKQKKILTKELLEKTE